MSEAVVPKVLVIGGGVSGAAFALHLMRENPLQRVRIEIVEPRALLGAGLAYSTDDPEHRMNGPADRMSALPDDALNFDAWFRSHGELQRDPAARIDGDRLIARRNVFGRYLDDLLRSVARRSPRAELIHTRRRAISAKERDGALRIVLDDGSSRDGDVIVLGVGHPPAGVPPFLAALPPSDRLIFDPWNERAIAAIPPLADVLIVGTGLTASDVAASLAARRHRGRILAVSRRGLLPLSRAVGRYQAYGDFSTAPATTASDLFHRARDYARNHQRDDGGPWEDVILALREQAPVIWGALYHEERLRFLRHLRSIWDSHRYPMAPQVSAVIERLQRTGQLMTIAAKILAVRSPEAGYTIDLQLRGRHGVRETERVGAIVNCTGPGHRSIVEMNPLLRALASKGLLRADPYGLGLAVDRESRVIANGGRSNRPIFAVGPLTRGTFGEIIGFPQITMQPREVARHVAWLFRAASTDATRNATAPSPNAVA